MQRAAAAQLTASLIKQSFTYSSPKTSLKALIEWSWSSKPAFVGKDIWGFSASEGMYVDLSNSNTELWYYKNVNTANPRTKLMKKPEIAGSNSCGKVVFNMNTPDYTTNTPNIAMAGKLYIAFTKQSKLTEVGVYAKYGHSTVSVTPSISVGATGYSFGITPSSKVTETKSLYKHWTR